MTLSDKVRQVLIQASEVYADRPDAVRVLRRQLQYVPVTWVYGYLAYLRDGRDQYFEPLHHSGATYLAALLAGSWYNYRSLRRYWAAPA